MNLETKKIAIATDVRFWKRATGAHQRIYSMVQFLQRHGHTVVTLLCAPLCEADSSKETIAATRQQIEDANLQVISVLDDWKPNGWIQEIVWEAKCIVNWMFGKDDVEEIESSNETRRIPDFGSPILYRRFHDELKKLDPDIVLAEYVTMAWLIPEDRKNQKPQWWVDTHDHLAERARQFREFEQPHWVEISQEEETEAMLKFDKVIAIQSEEAATFRELLNDRVPVFVAGHPAPIVATKYNDTRHSVENYSLGYFGSDNPSNVDAVAWFLKNVWPAVSSQNTKATFLLAGTICKSFPKAFKDERISVKQKIDNVAELYASFDIAINPVRFGTGLKIKNQEALAFGNPLVVTRQGAAGMVLPEDETTSSAISLARDAAQMSSQILGLLDSGEKLAQAKRAAAVYADQYLSPTFVYSELIENLKTV